MVQRLVRSDWRKSIVIISIMIMIIIIIIIRSSSSSSSSSNSSSNSSSSSCRPISTYFHEMWLLTPDFLQQLPFCFML